MLIYLLCVSPNCLYLYLLYLCVVLKVLFYVNENFRLEGEESVSGDSLYDE